MIPVLSEMLLRRGNFKVFRKMWRRSDPEEQEYNLKVFRSKGALTASLNYYRANFGSRRGEKTGNNAVPCLFIWGNHDIAVSHAAAEGNAQFMEGDYQFLELEAGHWLMQSAFAECKEAIASHIKKYTVTRNTDS